MWPSIIVALEDLIYNLYLWIDSIFGAIPGSWATYLTFFTMFNITRFLMGAIVGSTFGAAAFKLFRSRGSDRARRSKED